VSCHFLKSGVSNIHPISPRWNTHTSPWRTTRVTRWRPWPVAPLGPKTTIVPPIIVMATSEGMSSKFTAPKPNTPITFSMWWITLSHKHTPLSRVNGMHHTLAPRQNPRLKHTTRRAVPILVGHLSNQPLLMLPPEANSARCRSLPQ
jgi:hypothetical protein